jgi:TonB family protein
MKKIIIVSLSLMLMCAYTSNAQSKASKPKTSVHKNKKGVKFIGPEMETEQVIERISLPEPPPEELIGYTTTTTPIEVKSGEPNYPSGNNSFYDLLSRRIKMPDAAVQKGVKGYVKLSFTVGLQGNLSDFQVQNSLGFGCDEEAIRVIKSLGNWSPAQKDGQAFVSKKSISVAFGVPQLRESYTEQVKQEIPEPPREVMRVQEEEIYTAVEQPAEFPGGMAEYVKYIEKNLIYPEDAKTKKIEGNVYVQFMVFTDGSANNFQILKSMGSGTDEEAIRVLKSVPRWKPGNQSGRAVPSRLTIPVKFKLPE